MGPWEDIHQIKYYPTNIKFNFNEKFNLHTFSRNDLNLLDFFVAVVAGPMVAAPSSGVAMDSMISSVRDMLPFLGEGFVEKCLAHYNYKVSNENISVTFVGY